MILFNLALHDRLKSKGVTTVICHPGGMLILHHVEESLTRMHIVTLESKLLINSAVGEDLFADAYVLAIKRNDGK